MFKLISASVLMVPICTLVRLVGRTALEDVDTGIQEVDSVYSDISWVSSATIFAECFTVTGCIVIIMGL